MKSSLKKPIVFDGRNYFESDKMTEMGFTGCRIGRKPVIDDRAQAIDPLSGSPELKARIQKSTKTFWALEEFRMKSNG